MNNFNSKNLENELRNLPKLERSREADVKFFQQLRALAIIPTAHENAPDAAGAAPAFSRFSFPFRRLALSGSFILIFLLAAGSFAAYRPSVTRGKLLYPWKQAAERVELAAAFTPLLEVNTHLRFADRRLSEAENIIQRNPSLSWLAPVARAHEGEFHLDTEAAVYLSETLAERREEISLASEVVEQKIAAPEAAETALEKIEQASERHAARLADFENAGGANVKEIVREAVEEEENNHEVLQETRAAVKEARKNKATEFRFEMKRIREKVRQERQERKEEKTKQKEVRQEEKQELNKMLRNGHSKVRKKSKAKSEDGFPLMDNDIMLPNGTIPEPGTGDSGERREKERPDRRGDDLDIRSAEKVRSTEWISPGNNKKSSL